MANRLLVTGGTGFFGRALLRHFHAEAEISPEGCPRNYNEVIVVSRNPEIFAMRYPSLANAPWLHWVRADVSRMRTLSVLDELKSVDAVLHAATDSTDAGGLTQLEKLDQIVNGTRNVLESAVRLQAHRFLLTSSGGVYGPQPVDMDQISEAYCGIPDPLQPGSTYGLGKRLSEHLCILYGQNHRMETVIARCFAFVGQDLPKDAHFAIGNFIRDALWGSEIVVKGNGSPLRSYMDQRDLARWLLVMLKHGKSGEAYNVGSDEVVNIAELAYLIRDIISPEKKVLILGEHTADNQARNLYIPSIVKAMADLDLSVSIKLHQAIKNTALYFGD